MRLVAAALLSLAFGAGAAPRETVMRVPVKAFPESSTIVVTVYRPEGEGPFPLAVLSHGSPRTPEERRNEPRQRLAAQGERFVSMGFAVAVPTRRGYGESEGRFAEAYGTCSDPDYVKAGLETARDVRAAIESLRHEPWIDASRIVLVGQSAGGFGSVAAASQPLEGLKAVVNFAGGRGSLSPDTVCDPSRLVDAMARYGRTSRVPELWLYSANDHFFAPELARRMHAAFVAAGGQADFVEAPAVGLDGHAYFTRAMDDWQPRVARFLERSGVPR